MRLEASRFMEAGQPYLSALAGVARNTLTAKKGARKVDLALSPVVRIIAMTAEMAGVYA